MKKAWLWGSAQDDAFDKVKQELTKPTVLALYDPQANTKICAAASAYGLGAVLLQQHSGMHWKAVAYASRSLSNTEWRYSQIEKEALAIAWACEKFASYVLGKAIHLETDYKPLVPLLNRTNLDSLPARVLRFRLRLSRFDYSISHVPGKLLYTADTFLCSSCCLYLQCPYPGGSADRVLRKCPCFHLASKPRLSGRAPDSSTRGQHLSPAHHLLPTGMP